VHKVVMHKQVHKILKIVRSHEENRNFITWVSSIALKEVY
jgi:hypothetical protein